MARTKKKAAAKPASETKAPAHGDFVWTFQRCEIFQQNLSRLLTFDFEDRDRAMYGLMRAQDTHEAIQAKFRSRRARWIKAYAEVDERGKLRNANAKMEPVWKGADDAEKQESEARCKAKIADLMNQKVKFRMYRINWSLMLDEDGDLPPGIPGDLLKKVDACFIDPPWKQETFSEHIALDDDFDDDDDDELMDAVVDQTDGADDSEQQSED